MESMNISLPDTIKRFVEAQVHSGRYGSASEYVRELIRLDERRRAQERLEGLLLEGMGSPASEMTKADWAELRGAISRRRAKRASR